MQILYDGVAQYLHLSEEDTVLISGTLVEGIGNSHSDVDVYVFTKARPMFGAEKTFGHAFAHCKDMRLCTAENDPIFMTMDYYPNSAMHLDVEYWEYTELDDIVARVSATFVELMSHSDLAYEENLSRYEHLLIHRSQFGTPKGPLDIGALITAGFLKEYGYTRYRYYSADYWAFKDVAGAFCEGNMHLATELARKLLIRETRAALYLRGCTNYTEKWWHHYLMSIGEGLTNRLIATIDELVFRRDLLEDGPKFIRDCLDTVEELDHLNYSYLETSKEFPSPRAMIDMMTEEQMRRESRACIVQDHEFLYRRRRFSNDVPSYWHLLTYMKSES
jgi:hypothetical protein